MQTQIVTDECKQKFLELYQMNFHQEIPSSIIDVWNQDGVCLYSAEDNSIEGLVTITPVKQERALTKFVIVSCLCSVNSESTCELIKEGLMIAYEMGYQIALCNENSSMYRNSGFTETQIIRFNGEKKPLFAMELKWGAMKLIKTEVLLPYHVKN